MREYELTYIIRPDLDDEAQAALVARIEQSIAANGGRVVKADTWGKRRLAYPIRRYTEGTYILVLAELNDQAIREVDRLIKFSEDVLRHLLVRAVPVAPAAPAAPAAPVAPAAPAEAPAPPAEE